MSSTIKITDTDPGKPSITDEKSYTNVPGDKKSRAYESCTFFSCTVYVIIALIVLALTILLASGSSYETKNDYKRLIVFILTMVLCAIIILRRGAVHWTFKIAVLIPFFWFLVVVAISFLFFGF